MTFEEKVELLRKRHEELLARPNSPVEESNGVYRRYSNPVLTAAHVPLEWRYDLSQQSNPLLLERIGINAAFNAGAILLDGRHLMVVRVGKQGKSLIPTSLSCYT